MQDLSISIVVFELNESLLRKCLDSLLVAIGNAKEENLLRNTALTIIDNGNNEASIRLALDEMKMTPFIEPRLVAGQGNVGHGVAHNLAIMTSD